MIALLIAAQRHTTLTIRPAMKTVQTHTCCRCLCSFHTHMLSFGKNTRAMSSYRKQSKSRKDTFQKNCGKIQQCCPDPNRAWHVTISLRKRLFFLKSGAFGRQVVFQDFCLFFVLGIFLFIRTHWGAVLRVHYRVSKTHRMTYVCRSFSAKEPYN